MSEWEDRKVWINSRGVIEKQSGSCGVTQVILSTRSSSCGTISCIKPASEEDLEKQAVVIREQEETIRSQETRLRVAERDLAVEKAKADELFKRMVRVEQVAAHPEFTPGFKEERRRMWNQINLIGVLAGLCLGVLVAVVAVMAVS